MAESDLESEVREGEERVKMQNSEHRVPLHGNELLLECLYGGIKVKGWVWRA